MAIASEQAAVRAENGYVSEEQRRLAEQERAQRERRKQSLNLQRESILRSALRIPDAAPLSKRPSKKSNHSSRRWDSPSVRTNPQHYASR